MSFSIIQTPSQLTPNQVIQTHLTTTSSQALLAATPADIVGLSATITPGSVSKRVKVYVRWTGEMTDGNNQDTVFGIRRNGVAIGNPLIAGVRAYGLHNLSQGHFLSEAWSSPDNCAYSYIDSPATTTPVVYTATVQHIGATVLYNQRSVGDGNVTHFERLTSTIILEELD